jgi:hypothetical protein
VDPAAGVVILLIAVPSFSAIGAVVWGASGGPCAEADVLAAALAGVSPVEFLVAALGALAVTGEYSSGLIRVTLAALPRRLPVLLAKAFVVGAVTLVTGVISVLAAFVAVRLVLACEGLPAGAAAPAVLATAPSAGAYLSGLAFIGMAFEWVAQHRRPLAGFFGFLYVPPLLALLPGGRDFAPFLPSNAGAALVHASVAEPLTAATGALVFAAWSPPSSWSPLWSCAGGTPDAARSSWHLATPAPPPARRPPSGTTTPSIEQSSHASTSPHRRRPRRPRRRSGRPRRPRRRMRLHRVARRRVDHAVLHGWGHRITRDRLIARAGVTTGTPSRSGSSAPARTLSSTSPSSTCPDRGNHGAPVQSIGGRPSSRRSDGTSP